MKKLILFLLSILLTNNSYTMFWAKNKSKQKSGVDKHVAAEKISIAAKTIFKKKTKDEFAHYYHNWVIDDIIERTDAFVEDGNIETISRDVFEFFIAEIGKIAEARGVTLKNPQVQLVKKHPNAVGTFNSSAKPVYNQETFKQSNCDIYKRYRAKIAREKKRITAKTNQDDESATFINNDGTHSAESDDDASGPLVANLRHRQALDQQNNLTQLLSNKIVFAGGAVLVVFILYKIKQLLSHQEEVATVSQQEIAPSLEKENVQEQKPENLTPQEVF